jgi:hypothetical protein
MELAEGVDYLRADSLAGWGLLLKRLQQDEALWLQLSAAGRKVVRERYSPQRIAEKLRGILVGG